MRHLSRAKTIAGLRALASRNIVSSTAWLRSNEPRLLDSALLHFQSIAAARRAAGVPDPPVPRWWTQQRILAALLELHAKQQRITMPNLKKLGRFDLINAVRRVGGIVRARRLAGIPEPRLIRQSLQLWDEARVIDEIQIRAADHAPLALSKVPRPLLAAALRYCGSWQAAIEAAGLDYEQIRLLRRQYTKAEVIALLRDLSRTQPSLGWGDLYRHRAAIAMARCFGSIPAAVRSADIVGWPLEKQRSWTRRRVLDAIRLHRTESARRVSGLFDAARTYFGGIRAARRAAKVTQLRKQWSKALVIKELRAGADRGITAIDRNLKAACVRYFGNVPAARRAAGAQLPKLWTRDRVVAELHELVGRGQTTIREPLRSACFRIFGGIAATYRGADLYAAVARWSKPMVLQRLDEYYTANHHYQKPDLLLRAACVHAFGSLKAAAEAAGRARLAKRPAPRYSRGAPVAAAAASRVMPGASSRTRKAAPVGSKTPKSVMTRETTRAAVSG